MFYRRSTIAEITKLNSEMMIEPPTAHQNPSTCNPNSVCLVMHDVNMSIRAFTTSVKRPKVSRNSGKVSTFTIGLTIALTSVKIRPMTRKVRTVSHFESSAVSTLTPLTMRVVNQIETAITAVFAKNLMG